MPLNLLDPWGNRANRLEEKNDMLLAASEQTALASIFQTSIDQAQINGLIILLRETNIDLDRLMNRQGGPLPSAEQLTQKLKVEVEKITRHDLIVTTSKLGAGAFGWQLAFLLALDCLKESRYEIEITAANIKEKAIICVAAGIGATLFLSATMLAVQAALAKWDNGVPAQRLLVVAALLCLSVPIPDGSWQLLADAYISIDRKIGRGVGQSILTVSLYALFCLLEAFTFQWLNNFLNRFHPGGDQVKFVCDHKFTAILWSAYFGFYVLPFLFYLATGLEADDLLLAPFIAAIGTAIFPLLLGLGNRAETLMALKRASGMVVIDIEKSPLTQSDSIGSALNTSLISVDIREHGSPAGSVNEKGVDAIVQKNCLAETREFVAIYGCNTPVVLFSQCMNGFVRGVSDMVPTCK